MSDKIYKPRGPITLRKPVETFHGDPCRKCGGTERYVNGGRCVTCVRQRLRNNRRRKAEELSLLYPGQTHYEHHSPCGKCGTSTRYVSSDKCVHCECDYTRTRYSDPEVKALTSEYNRTPERRKAAREYKASEHGRAITQAYFESLWGRAKHMYVGARVRAKQKGLPFTITNQMVYDRLVLLNGIAEVTNDKFDFTVRKGVNKNPYGPSLDQKIPSAGYTAENFQIVTNWFNVFKADYPQEEALEILRNAQLSIIGGVGQ